MRGTTGIHATAADVSGNPEPRVLWKKHKNPKVSVNLHNGLQTLSNGDILMPFTYWEINKHKNVDPAEQNLPRICDLSKGNYTREIRYMRSRDHDATWTKEDPQMQAPASSYGRPVETACGRLIKPSYEHGMAWLQQSRNFGKTWGPRQMLQNPYGSEVNICKATNGSLFLIVRGAGWPPIRTFGTTFSQDGSKTWSKNRSARVQGKMPDLLVLPSGRILMAVGLQGTPGGQYAGKIRNRDSLCVLFISDDHGRTWKRDIEFQRVDPDSSIIPTDGPGIWLLDDGKVLVVMQAQAQSTRGHPQWGFNVGNSIIANVIDVIQ